MRINKLDKITYDLFIYKHKNEDKQRNDIFKNPFKNPFQKNDNTEKDLVEKL